MKDYSPPGVIIGAYVRGSVSRSCCCSCTMCTELDAEFRVSIPIAGERITELLCSTCAGSVTGRDLEATPSITDVPQCEYVDLDVLDQLPDRRTSAYRGRRIALIPDLA